MCLVGVCWGATLCRLLCVSAMRVQQRRREGLRTAVAARPRRRCCRCCMSQNVARTSTIAHSSVNFSRQICVRTKRTCQNAREACPPTPRLACPRLASRPWQSQSARGGCIGARAECSACMCPKPPPALASGMCVIGERRARAATTAGATRPRARVMHLRRPAPGAGRRSRPPLAARRPKLQPGPASAAPGTPNPHLRARPRPVRLRGGGAL